jgi:N-carbamoylputrescine amidase
MSATARNVTVAATQFACSWDLPGNLIQAEAIVREAVGQGAGLVLLQELFATPYFCIEQDPQYFELASTVKDSTLLQRFQTLARELGVVLPISFFEREHNAYFNSVAVINADGALLGVYRKSHIPDGPGYQEKYYFSPGDTGFRVWDTAVGRIGVGICWDQWFPECARSMALQGAELLLYPTAIGSEPPPAAPLDSRAHWQRTQQGHAAANLMPLIASNRIGVERSRRDPEQLHIRFYGSSFITDGSGAMVAVAEEAQRQIILTTFDLYALQRQRDAWFLFRDRRPDLYAGIATLGGTAATKASV